MPTVYDAAGGFDGLLRAVTCVDQALEDAGWADDDALRQALHDYFAWATTTTMSRCPVSADDVPAGLAVPHRSWTGPVGSSQG